MDLDRLVDEALAEDVGPGDLTTEATVPAQARASGRMLAKQDLVVCGHDVARRVFERLAARRGEEVRYEVRVPDGAEARDRVALATVEGPARVLLTGERVALNFLMKLSGIATHVRAYVDAAGPDGPAVVDTRKTTPLLRQLEKAAVRAGGARNHRHALYDGVMIKDNHIAATGSITGAVAAARAYAHHLVRIEVEVGTLPELDEALQAGADVVLLDNMDDEGLSEAVRRARAIRPEVLLEASGNMTPERIARIRHLGLDLVSAGGLIHQATWADISFGLDVA